jgi:methyl-accepting chemotaxis protein
MDYASSIALAVATGVAVYLLTLRRQTAKENAVGNEGAMLRTLIDHLPDLLYVKDVNGRFLLANIAVARIMGAGAPDELLGKNDFDFHPKELATRYHEDEQTVVHSGKPLLAREEECRDPTGKVMHLQTTKIPLRDATGTVTGLVGIGRDITRRIEQARALDAAVRESREVIQAVLAGANDRRIAIHDKTGNLQLLAQSINELIDSVSTTVAQTMQVVGRAVEGDLTSRMNADDKLGDFKILAASVNSMIHAMMEVVAGLRKTSRAVQLGAEEISRGSLELSKRTEEQASNLTETTSSMEQMTSMVKNSAENAMRANQLAVAAREYAERGGSVVDAAVAAMSEINAASSRIAEIIAVIDEIAFQTNLLALNASVEAARAGEQGKGFAVVASEVRNLASRSAGAANEIKALIQDSVGKVNEGTKLVDESGKVLGEIVIRVKKVTDVMAEIANLSREQAGGIEQVNRAVAAIDSMTQQNAALVQEAAAAAQALNAQATSLLELIGHYRISSGTIRDVDASVVELRARPMHGRSAAGQSPPAASR